MDKIRIVNRCDRIILASLFGIAYFLPISKGIIEFLSILAIVFFIFKKIIQRKAIPFSYLNFGIFAFLSICFISIFLSSNPKISSRTFTCKILQELFFFFVVVDTLNNERRFRTFLYILFVSSLLLGIDGIYQSFTYKDFIRHRPTIFISRIYATFPTPNDFGCYLVTVMPFLTTTFFTKFKFKAVRFLLGGLFILLFICLIMTVSRGAWYAFVASALFLGVWVYPLGVFFLLLGLFIILTQPFYPALIKERLGNFFLDFDLTALSDNSNVERKIFWMAGWKMFISKPWLGLGIGTFMFNFKRYVVETYQNGPHYAHNCYLQMLSEIGVIGLISFLLILLLFFYKGIKALRNQQKTFSWYVLLASLAAILGYCVQMSVDTIFYSLDLGILFWLILGLGISAMNNLTLEKQKT